ncbi:MAG: L-serine ammonia-lyase, partial [Deltaproteobacteria bacterium]|nr:L-serine ammonia-lyase [Deltaproteobacteria bacterium]
ETSLLELFKVGPGPSSSHTIGPMLAGCDFLELCRLQEASLRERAARFRVRLYGSLSATGVGHGTDTAVVAGLLGMQPEACPSSLLTELHERPRFRRSVPLDGACLTVCMEDVECAELIHDFPYSNTLVCELLDGFGAVLTTREYYSVGGGFIQWKGWKPPERGRPAYRFATMREIKDILSTTGLTLHEVVLSNESAITGMSRPRILERLDALLAHMEEGVKRGLEAQGPLPGSLNVQRKAAMLRRASAGLPLRGDRFLCGLNAYAFAVAEENAAGGVVVTAPTCGAAGVVPAVMYAMRHDLTVGDRGIREGLLAAAIVGYLAKHNASIAGAEVGCQGEVGVASAMAAAMLTHARGGKTQIVENAAEIALEHHLGLTCDPVHGLVQIPCIERNAMGAIKAYNAALIASSVEPSYQRVSLDAAIRAMAETGRDMHSKFKETSLGGLAVSMVNC